MVLGLNEFGRKLEGNKACLLQATCSVLSQGWISATASLPWAGQLHSQPSYPQVGPSPLPAVRAAEAGGLMIKPCGRLSHPAVEAQLSEGATLNTAVSPGPRGEPFCQNYGHAYFTDSVEQKSQGGGHTASGGST